MLLPTSAQHISVLAPAPWLFLAVVAVGACLAYFSPTIRNKISFPPGPWSLPLLGHAHLITSNFPSTFFHSLAQKFGNVAYLNIPGRPMVVISSASVANELLNQRGMNYSDRPTFTMLEQVLGWSPALAFLPYGKRSKKQRKTIQQYFSAETLRDFQSFQTRHAQNLALNLADDKEGDYKKHIKFYVSALMIMLAFGHEVVKAENDDYFQITEDATWTLHNAGAMGMALLDFFPFLKHLPSWLPGAHFARFGRDWRWAVRMIHEYPVEDIQRQMARGTANPSFVSNTLESIPNMKDPEEACNIEDIKGLAANIFSGGTDTLMATLEVFLLAMTLHPDVQAKAQAEIERVVGKDRIPDFNDRDNLPFVEAIMHETVRWHPVVPLGIPHKSVNDDVFQGYKIPGGALIVANAHSMSRDAAVYADPESFNPNRFVASESGGKAAEPYFNAAYGFGRRACPGQHVADSTLWIAMVTILATTRIGSADVEKPDLPNFVSGGILRRPEVFDCPISHRSDGSRKSLREALDQASP